jgi:hypothetical protein
MTVPGALAQTQQTAPPPPDQDQAPHAWRKAADVPPPPPAPEVAPDPQQVPPPADQPAAPPPAFDQAQANPVPPPPPQPGYSNFPSFPSAPQAGQLPNPNAPLPGNGGYGPGYGQGGPQGMQQRPPQGGMQQMPPQNVPAHLTIKPGTYVTVRVSQPLSSDKNQQGDTFFATLAEPIIVDGVVVAQRGETVSGRVTEAQKAGRVEGTSKLGVELISLSLVDGQQLPIQSQMIGRTGGTSVGRDAGAIAGTTALGAAIGAGVDWGRGAAIGAGAGAAAGILGVLLTRGRPTIIYPETVLTFRLQAPVEIATDRAPQAFHFATNRDYGTGGAPAYAQRPPAPGYAPGYYGPAYYPYPYYWGPGLSVYVGPGYYRGFRRW